MPHGHPSTPETSWLVQGDATQEGQSAKFPPSSELPPAWKCQRICYSWLCICRLDQVGWTRVSTNTTFKIQSELDGCDAFLVQRRPQCTILKQMQVQGHKALTSVFKNAVYGLSPSEYNCFLHLQRDSRSPDQCRTSRPSWRHRSQ